MLGISPEEHHLLIHVPLALEHASEVLRTLGCRSFALPLFVYHLMAVPYKPRQYRVDSKSPRKQLSPIAVSLATSSTKKKKKKPQEAI